MTHTPLIKIQQEVPPPNQPRKPISETPTEENPSTDSDHSTDQEEVNPDPQTTQQAEEKEEKYGTYSKVESHNRTSTSQGSMLKILNSIIMVDLHTVNVVEDFVNGIEIGMREEYLRLELATMISTKDLI